VQRAGSGAAGVCVEEERKSRGGASEKRRDLSIQTNQREQQERKARGTCIMPEQQPQTDANLLRELVNHVAVRGGE